MSFFCLPWRLCSASLIALLAMTAHADESSVQELNAQLSQIDDAEASFSQHIIDARGVRGKEFTGHMQVRRPGHFRWETKTPYAQNIITDGRTVWVYDPDLNQVIIESLDRQVGDTPALLLSSDAATMAKNFDIRKEDDVVPGESSFLLKPRKQDAMFEAMRIKFMRGRIEEMQLKDAMGQKTRIRFQEVRYHVHLDKALFHFTPPQGAEIIQQ